MSEIKKLKPIFCLMGPTASGKTDLAIQLREYFPLEIVSVDSAMVYRDMDIGTAKPSEEILKKAPHRLINICDPNKAYSAAQFRTDALREIEDIFSQDKIPLLVGGTMLYFRALQQGLSNMPSGDDVLRKKLYEEGESKGWQHLHSQLAEVDPIAANRIHPNDPQRIQRALEVYLLSGKNITTWQKESTLRTQSYEFINIAITPLDRALLHQRIADRFSEMLAHGFVDEVKNLYKRGDLTPNMSSVRAVGYRQAWDYVEGKCSYDEMKEKGIIATRQLAKRQLTWLRTWPNVVWFDSEDSTLLLKVRTLLSSYLKKRNL